MPKISELTSKTTLAGTEEAPLRDGTGNVRATIDAIANRAVAANIAAAHSHNHDAGAITTGQIALARLPVATSGTSSTTQLVRADDTRLSNERAPLDHDANKVTTGTFHIDRIPVAPNNTVSATQVVRANDDRLSNARTPTTHNHTAANITDLNLAVYNRIKAVLTQGANVTLTADDGAQTLAIASSGTGGGGGSGSVTSVAVSGGTTGLTTTGGPVTTSGTITLGGTLGVANGGTGANTLTGYVRGSGTSALTASTTIPGADITGNITGNAANVTGTVAVANGGTGATTEAGARTNLGAAASGLITASGLTLAAPGLVGRSTAGSGALEAITLGSRMTLSGGVLDANVPAGNSVSLSSAFRATTIDLRGMSFMHIVGNNTLTLTSGNAYYVVAYWPWSGSFDRVRVRASTAYTGGTSSFQVAIYDIGIAFGAPLSGSLLALFDTWGTPVLSTTTTQVSAPLASPVSLTPGFYCFAVWSSFSGGTGTPALAATGTPIGPNGIFGGSFTAATRSANTMAMTLGAGGFTATLPNATPQATNTTTPLLLFDNA